jgi:ABC-2 type transport system ATP-binding protein
MPTPALKITNLRKVYRRGNVAVEDVSLTVPEGEFFGFLGPNGAGKSTTIHCITGIANPTSGTIEVFGLDAVKNYREARRLVGLCPQEFNVDPFAKPADIVDWAGGYFGMNRAQRKSRVDYLMERFELTPHLKKSFRELSGGLKRRVVLARALVHDPRLIILDEPTAGVDVELRRVLWNYLTEINQQDGRTIVLTSHYLEEVERLCRHIAIVAKGRIVREGTRTRWRERPAAWSAPIWSPRARRPIMSRGNR